MTIQIGTHANPMMVMEEVVIEGVMVWVLFKEEGKKDDSQDAIHVPTDVDNTIKTETSKRKRKPDEEEDSRSEKRLRYLSKPYHPPPNRGRKIF